MTCRFAHATGALSVPELPHRFGNEMPRAASSDVYRRLIRSRHVLSGRHEALRGRRHHPLVLQGETEAGTYRHRRSSTHRAQVRPPPGRAFDRHDWWKSGEGRGGDRVPGCITALGDGRPQKTPGPAPGHRSALRRSGCVWLGAVGGESLTRRPRQRPPLQPQRAAGPTRLPQTPLLPPPLLGNRRRERGAPWAPWSSRAPR